MAVTHGRRRAGRNLRLSSAGAAPRYQQVKSHVLARIASGSLGVHARVPSENELVRALGVARMTANRALRELAADGVLVRVAGVGTFVADRRVHAHPLEIRNIADEIRERGHQYAARVVKLEKVEADAALGERMGVAAKATLFHSSIVHCENDIPLQLEDRYVSPAAAPGYLKNDFTRMTPHEFLVRIAPLHQAEHTVQAVMPDSRLRRLLKLDADEACLLIHRRTWNAGRVVTVANLYHPGKRYELSGTFRPSA